MLGAAQGVAYAKDTLVIADSSRYTGLSPQNRRVLSITTSPRSSRPPPLPSATIRPAARSALPAPNSLIRFDVVVGQPDFSKSDPALTQAGMRLPTAVATDGTMLAVADTENNRILLWKNIPASSSTPADIVLGQDSFTTFRQPNVLDAKSFRGPQGVWLQNGKLFVADTQNHRVLIWNSVPTQNNQPADIVLGQKDFLTAPEPDLTKITTAAHANTLLNPTSVTSDGQRLVVSDLGFNRVLIWNSIPTQTQQPADVVVGQPDMDSDRDNASAALCPSNGTNSTTNLPTFPARCGATISFPRFALSDGTRLYISDAGNDRVLVFNRIPTFNGATADVVLGQPDMTSNINTSLADLFHPNLQNSASDLIPAPGALAWDGETLYVADPTNRRVLLFSPLSPDIQRDGVRNAASLNIFAVRCSPSPPRRRRMISSPSPSPARTTFTRP